MCQLPLAQQREPLDGIPSDERVLARQPLGSSLHAQGQEVTPSTQAVNHQEPTTLTLPPIGNFYICLNFEGFLACVSLKK